MDRLRKLEGVVSMLGTQVQEGDDEGTSETAEKGAAQVPPPAGKTEEELSQEEKIARACRELKELRKQKWEEDKEKKPPPQTGLEKRFGRLVVDEGRSRYINPSFWASLSDEVENIKDLLDNSEEEDERDNYPSPETTHSSSSHQGFVFGYSSQNVDMMELHPPSEQVPVYWRIFRENVDPLVKVIHAPSMEPTILQAKDQLEKVHKGLECLMFAIYYGAVTSMWEEECRAYFGEEKSVLLARYRFGMEQALARADFLQTDEMIVLQAFVLFLISLRRNDDARVIWTLTGLVVRMAQTLGLHRDGTHYGLPPFQIEMRRRLWWQICILDSRASEDHGADPTIIDQLFDTQMPINANDEDLDPDMGALPEPRTGCTQMTFGLIRFEISSTMKRLAYVPPGPKRCNKFFSELSVEKKEKWVRDLHERLENMYLKDTDMSVPLYWVIATISRLIMSKMWLIIYHPFQRLDGGSSLPREVRDKLFTTSLENVEYSILLETEEKTKRWGWLFRTYVQWHAIAFMLSEMTTRTKGPEVERAWKAINFIVGRRWNDEHSGDNHSNKLKGHLWKPLRRLMDRARTAREEALKKDEEDRLKAQGPMEDLEKTSSMMKMDFGVDRLFPELSGGGGDTTMMMTMGMTPSNWNDLAGTFPPMMASPMGNAAATNGGFNDSTLGISTSADMNGTVNSGFAGNGVGDPFSLPSMPNDWLLNGDSTLQHAADPIMPNGANAALNSTMQNGGGALTLQNVGDNNLDTNSFDAISPTGAGPLLADGSVDWGQFDDLVQQYGMDVDSHQGNGGQPMPFGSTFSGITQWY